MGKGNVFTYGSPSLGLEYLPEYRSVFFHCINCFLSMSLEAFWGFLLSKQGTTHLENIYCGQRPKFGYDSAENYLNCLNELLLRKSIAYSGLRSASPLSLKDTLCNNTA